MSDWLQVISTYLQVVKNNPQIVLKMSLKFVFKIWKIRVTFEVAL